MSGDTIRIASANLCDVLSAYLSCLFAAGMARPTLRLVTDLQRVVITFAVHVDDLVLVQRLRIVGYRPAI